MRKKINMEWVEICVDPRLTEIRFKWVYHEPLTWNELLDVMEELIR